MKKNIYSFRFSVLDERTILENLHVRYEDEKIYVSIPKIYSFHLKLCFHLIDLLAVLVELVRNVGLACVVVI